jgi:hypothetical protein
MAYQAAELPIAVPDLLNSRSEPHSSESGRGDKRFKAEMELLVER